MGDLYDPFADEFGDDEEDEDYDDYVAFENPTVETFVVNDDESDDGVDAESEDEADAELNDDEPDDESGDFLRSEPPKRTSMAEIRAKMAARQEVVQAEFEPESEPEPEPKRRERPERDFVPPRQTGTGNGINGRTGASRGPRTANRALECETEQGLPESVYEEPDFSDEPMELPPPRRVMLEEPELDESELNECEPDAPDGSVESGGEPEYDEIGLGGFANALVRLFSGKKKRK